MSHFETLEQVAIGIHEGVEAREIFVAGSDRRNDPPRRGLEILEHVGFGEGEIEFVGIENLKDNHFMTVKSELFEAERDIFRRFKQIGEEENDAAAMDQTDRLLQKLGQARATGGLKHFEMTQHQAELSGSL